MNYTASPLTLRIMRTRHVPVFTAIYAHIHALIACTSAILLALLCLAVYHMGMSASAGLELSKEQARLEVLKDDQARLSVELAHMKAPGRIEQEIAKSGFVVSTSPIFVSSGSTLAQR